MPLQGVDISYHQGKINYSLLNSKSDFIIHRKSIGYYQDYNWPNNWKNLTKPKSIYHYFYPTLLVDRQFNILIQDVSRAELAMPPALDVEYKHTMSKENAAIAVKKMLQLIENWYGEPPIIYTAYYIWRDYYYTGGDFSRYPLWVANYDVASPSIPLGFNKYKIWQFSADDNNRGEEFGVSSDDIDINKMVDDFLSKLEYVNAELLVEWITQNSTVEINNMVVNVNDLLTWINNNKFEPELPEPSPPPLPEFVVNVVGNFRTSPGTTSSNLIRLIGVGERVFDLGERSGDWWKVRDTNGVDGWFWEPGYKLSPS